MAEFPTHTHETAPEAAKPIIEQVQAKYGFLPNLLATMATAPALLEAYATLGGIFAKTDLTETERQVILMTNNVLNGCTYCMAAHTTISKMAKVDDTVIEALRNDTPIPDAKLEALRTFARVVNVSRGWPSDADIEAFLAAGYTEQTVLEVVLGTAFKTLSNYTNHIASTEVDAAFAPNAWSAPEKSAA